MRLPGRAGLYGVHASLVQAGAADLPVRRWRGRLTSRARRAAVTPRLRDQDALRFIQVACAPILVLLRGWGLARGRQSADRRLSVASRESSVPRRAVSLSPLPLRSSAA